MYKNEFPLRSDTLYLNHAAVSPWPKRTAEAVQSFCSENISTGARYYPNWLKTEQQLRQQLAWLINASSSSDIALQKNTSEALSTIAFGLSWEPGDNVVSYQHEFPSNRVVWQSLSRFGVNARLVDFDPECDPEQALIEACDKRTKLISVSSVQYASGLRMDLQRIARFCRKQGILLCIDAIQSLGVFEFDVQSLGADFVVADGHKWMMGPEGLALLYVKPDIRDQLQLNQYGWHMLANGHDFDSTDLQPATTAVRFECGSPNTLGIQALSASLSLTQEVGFDTIEQRILENTETMIRHVQSANQLKLLSDITPQRRSGIVTFSAAAKESDSLYRELMNRGVICAARGGGVRFSPHFYTTQETIDKAFDIVLDLL